MSEKHGGPAFPIQGFSTRNGQGFQAVMADGMTLRDYFAAKALPSLMAHSGGYWGAEHLRAYAATAYEMADAMLEARL